MSEMSKKARAAAREKANRLGGSKSPGKVDASSWTPGSPLNADRKTGARPIRARIYKHGGKIQGDRGPINAGRKARASGGKVSEENRKLAVRLGGDRKALNVPDDYGKPKVKTRDERKDGGALNVHDTVGENKKELGSFHEGGYKKGGRAERASGGKSPRFIAQRNRDGSATVRDTKWAGSESPRKSMDDAVAGAESRNAKYDRAEKCGGGAMKGGGKVSLKRAEQSDVPSKGRAQGKKAADSGEGTSLRRAQAVSQDERAKANNGADTKKHHRDERKSGGRAKGKTNINIIIGNPQDNKPPPLMPQAPVRPPMAPPPPPPGPPPGAMAGPPPGPPPGMGAPMGGPGMPPPHALMRRSGGRTVKFHAGAGSGPGRLEKTAHAKARH